MLSHIYIYNIYVQYIIFIYVYLFICTVYYAYVSYFTIIYTYYLDQYANAFKECHLYRNHVAIWEVHMINLAIKVILLVPGHRSRIGRSATHKDSSDPRSVFGG